MFSICLHYQTAFDPIYINPEGDNKMCLQNVSIHLQHYVMLQPRKPPYECDNIFIHSIGMCRMWWFLAVLRRSFHSSLLCTFSCYPSPPTILPSSLTSSCHLFFGLVSIWLFPNSYIILFWEFYFLPLSEHAQTSIIYLTLLSLLQ